MDEEQPEVQDILEKKSRLEEVWSGAHAQWDETDSLVQGGYNIWGNEEDRATRSTMRSNQARVIIDHTSDNLLPYKPQWHREKIGQAEDAQESADKVEAWVDAVWSTSSLDQLSIPMKVLGRNMLKYNYGVLETVFNTTGMPRKPKEGADNFSAKEREYQERSWNFNPFGLRAPHPTAILLPCYERRPSYAIKREKWASIDIKTELDHKRDLNHPSLVSVDDYDMGRNPMELVDVVEYYSRDWHAIIAPGGRKDGDMLLIEANPHRIVPIIHAYGGFGDMPSGEDGTDPMYMAQGFLWAVRDLIRLLDQVISAKAELEMKAAYAPMVAPEETLERIAQLLQAGANMIPGDAREIGYIPIQQLPQYLTDFQDRIERQIVVATISTVAFGERPVGVDTVGQHAMMLQVSFKRMLETMEQLSFMASEVASTWMRMLAGWDAFVEESKSIDLGGKITVRGKDLRAEDLQKNYHIVATFPLSDEAVRMQRTQQGASLVAQGLKSRKRHLEEDQGVTNISAEEDQILTENVMGDPILVTAFAEKKRQELGVQELYEDQMKRMAAERQQGFAQTQATEGLPGGAPPQFVPPGSQEEMTVNAAEGQALVRPPAATAGTAQMNGSGV